MVSELLPRAADLLYQEAAFLDERRWPEWLALYAEDAEFWVPAWDEEGKPTDDPQAQLSLIYYDSRTGLEDRVWRIESGLSPASRLLVRTCHIITNVRLTEIANTLFTFPRTGRSRFISPRNRRHWPISDFMNTSCGSTEMPCGSQKRK